MLRSWGRDVVRVAYASRGANREATMAFTINVNGAAYSVDVDADTPLLWVLRDLLGMSGTKFGCGAALCGACTVHVAGAPTRSCVTPIAGIGVNAITTIEAGGQTPQAKGPPQPMPPLPVR